jgi:hypothetical protein
MEDLQELLGECNLETGPHTSEGPGVKKLRRAKRHHKQHRPAYWGRYQVEEDVGGNKRSKVMDGAHDQLQEELEDGRSEMETSASPRTSEE